VILQVAEPGVIELIKTIGAPVATALGSIYFYHKFIAAKANEHDTKEILYKLDMALTGHFDQLRRDLEVKIEKTMENRLTAYLFRQELDRKDSVKT